MSFLKNRPIYFHINSTSVIRPLKQNQLNFFSTEKNKPLPAPITVFCRSDSSYKPILVVTKYNAKYLTWYSIRFKFVKKTRMSNPVKNLGYIKCYSSSSSRPAQNPWPTKYTVVYVTFEGQNQEASFSKELNKVRGQRVV